MFRALFSAGCLCLVAGLTALPGHAQQIRSHSVVHRVAIKNYAFVPAVVTIAPGDTVVWVNRDADNHTVTSDQGTHGAFQSGALQANGVFRHVFKTGGVVRYHCDFHPFMHGTVRIKARTR